MSPVTSLFIALLLVMLFVACVLMMATWAWAQNLRYRRLRKLAEEQNATLFRPGLRPLKARLVEKGADRE